MNRHKDDEIFDWDMDLEGNFEDAFDNSNEVPDERHNSYVATSPQEWVRFSRDELNRVERKEGDGTSIDSQTYVDSHSDSEDEDEKEHEEQEVNPDGRQSDAKQVYNSPRPYLPTNGQSETARFKILDDEYDISPDVAPMEFRGSLKTDADSYGKSSTGRCTCVRYLAVALLMFAFGILLGYFAGVRQGAVESVKVTGPAEAATVTTTRFFTENVTMQSSSGGSVEIINTTQGQLPVSQKGPLIL